MFSRAALGDWSSGKAGRLHPGGFGSGCLAWAGHALALQAAREILFEIFDEGDDECGLREERAGEPHDEGDDLVAYQEFERVCGGRQVGLSERRCRAL